MKAVTGTLFFLLFIFSSTLHATLFHEAVEHKDEALLEKALAMQIDINAFTHDRTALNIAIELGDEAMIEALVEAGANVNIGKPLPLYQALSQKKFDIAHYLIKSGADINGRGDKTEYGMLYDLLLDKNYEAVRLLLDEGAWFSQNHALNVFSLALSYAPLDVIEAFISREADLSKKDSYLGTPIDIALRYDRNDVLELLIDNGAKTQKYHYIRTAVEHNNTKALELLVEGGAKLNHKDKSLVAKAITFNNLEMLQTLLEAGVSIDQKDRHGCTALSKAYKEHKEEIFKWLMNQELKPNIHAKTLFIAIKRNDKNTTLALLMIRV